MRRIGWIVVGIIVLLILLFGGAAITFYTDWLWFNDLGFGVIFSKILWARISLAIGFGALFFIIVYANLWLARRLAPPTTRRYDSSIEDELRQRFSALAKRGLGVLLIGGTLVVALMFGLESATHWDEWLKFTNAVPFGQKDAIFGKDISFYVFQLPFLNYLYGWLFATTIVALLASALLHYANDGLDYFANTPRFSPGVKAHLAILISILFFLKAGGYWLARYSLVTSPYTAQASTSQNTLFYGASYTDMHARYYALLILMVSAVICGLIVLVNIRRSGIRLAIGALVGLIGLSIIVGAAYPSMMEQFSVKPNQLQKQTPYIKHAIKATRQAFQVDADTVASRQFDYTDNLSEEEISRNQAVVQNLRLWDYEPLKRVYNQLQVFQQYYDFNDVDIDRYMIDGKYRQVMLSARELSTLPDNAQTWVNQYLRYTHGYGYVMSPVNVIAKEGMPAYFAQGIPTATVDGLKLDRPQIYFGEMTNDYMLVDTRQKEFDYLAGNKDRSNNFAAGSGTRIGSFFRKLAFSIRFHDWNIILSNDLRPSSRILFRRNIVERAQTLFPFLSFDGDPYLVTVGGKLYWLHDAYTTTNLYPYSEVVPVPFANGTGDANYVRNSVKLVTDAYTGKVQAYVSDPKDPIIKTYSRIFPGVFKPIGRMSKELRSHIRYPEDLFTVQVQVYSKYHMTIPSMFYSGTDMWQIPTVDGLSDSQSTGIQPYYIITRLPNSSKDEFILIVPLVRAGKQNMVAWMAAKCDDPDYGKLIAYEFPPGRRVFGPNQIMSRANQNTDISEKLTLWGQQKSQVVRGNLLAIPIENSILYIEPLYLESTTNQIPEFKTVIVALGEKVVMRDTLEQALADVVGVSNLPAVASASTPKTTPAQLKEPSAQPGASFEEVHALAQQARDQFARAEELQREGDWAGYGREITALKKTLADLEKKAGQQ